MCTDVFLTTKYLRPCKKYENKFHGSRALELDYEHSRLNCIIFFTAREGPHDNTWIGWKPTLTGLETLNYLLFFILDKTGMMQLANINFLIRVQSHFFLFKLWILQYFLKRNLWLWLRLLFPYQFIISIQSKKKN